jgi:guanylate kinase
MSSDPSGRLIILSGPSCIGKTPLEKALGKFFPELHGRMSKLVLYNDRNPRPGERDGVAYHFRTRDQLEALREDERYLIIEVRNDLHALDIDDLLKRVKNSDLLYEGNPYVSLAIRNHPLTTDIPQLSVFLSPLSKAEILDLQKPGRNVSLPDFLTRVMRRKLLRRASRQKGELSLEDLKDIEMRASSAYQELKMAHQFDFVIPNHDGEDSENWDAFYYPLGDARNTLLNFVELLQGKIPSAAEKWDKNLFH